MAPSITSGKLGTILPNLEEPMVIHYYQAASAISRAVKIHPNIVTLCRLGLMIWLTWSFYKGRHVVLAACVLQICFFLDHLDGEMARTHDLVTPLGDYLDHILDITYGLPLLYIVGLKLRKKTAFWPVMCILGAAVALSSVVISCQEIVLAAHDPSKASPSLVGARRLCPAWVGVHLPVLRYAGAGMLHLLVGGAMVYSHYYA